MNPKTIEKRVSEIFLHIEDMDLAELVSVERELLEQMNKCYGIIATKSVIDQMYYVTKNNILNAVRQYIKMKIRMWK